MNDKLMDALYKACAETKFRVGFQRDSYRVSVEFLRDNNKSTWIAFHTLHGWSEDYYNHEEIVRRGISGTEALKLLREGFKEFGGEFLEV